MKHRWAALGTVLALSALLAGSASAQAQKTPPSGQQRSAGTLKQNHPNPFNPETTIPFLIDMEGDPPVCKDPSVRHRVSLRIYNVLNQLVAIPILQGGGEQAGRPLDKITLGCGDYRAFWDGTKIGTSQQVSSGMYIYILDVDGIPTVRRMWVSK